MTVSSQTNNATFVGNGITTVFPLPFRFFSNGDVFAYFIDPTTGASTPMVLGTDYTLTGAGEPEVDGNAVSVLTTTVPLANGRGLYVERIMQEVQNTDIVNQGEFFASTHEDVFDRLTMLIQQANANSHGAIRVAIGDPEPARLPTRLARAYKLMGFDANGDPIAASPVDGSVSDFALDLLNQTDPAKGASLVGFVRNSTGAVGRKVSEHLSDRINVKDFGAKGDGITDDWAAIEAARLYAASRPSVSVYPYQVPPIWFPHGVYLISKSILFQATHRIDGDNARIVAKQGFIGATIPLAAGGTEVSKTMLIFLNGNKGDTSGVIRWGASVGSGITIDCSDIADHGIYIERMPYSRINCEIQGCVKDGVQIGAYCWGINFDGIVIENFTDYALHFLINSACNGMSVANPIIWGEFKTGKGGLLFDKDAEANGVSITGGFIEKVDYGVLISSGNGPITISGVDFEQCTFNVIRAAAGVFTGQKIGPINVENCFMHSISASKIYADHATFHVSGCRMFPGSVDFETDSFSRGVINALENRYMASDTIGIGAAVSLSSSQTTGVSKQLLNYLPHKSASFVQGYALKNYQYKDSPFLQSSGHEFYSFYSGGPTGQYVSYSDWWVSEYQHVTAPGVLNKKIGVRLANDSGQNSFQPMADNITSCGGASARWTEVRAVNGTINTSDEREKTFQRPQNESERMAAIELKSKIKAFKWKDSVARKGDSARWHFGCMAQDVSDIFRKHGLDPNEYGLFCYDEWPETPELTDENNNILSQKIEAGNRYGLRYDQLLAFIISAM